MLSSSPEGPDRKEGFAKKEGADCGGGGGGCSRKDWWPKKEGAPEGSSLAGGEAADAAAGASAGAFDLKLGSCRLHLGALGLGLGWG